MPPTADPRASPSWERKAAETARRLCVLLVEDVEEIRRLYTQYFGLNGVRVTSAADGLQALEIVAHDPPDVVVLDMSLPRMSGWEMLEKLRAAPATRGIPVVVLTGCVFPGSSVDAFRAGADSYLTKPCAPSVLLSEIIRLIGGPAPNQA
jgi:CheY-like chemotaxis protein